jgi:very-short-patch-repair endonuclease
MGAWSLGNLEGMAGESCVSGSIGGKCRTRAMAESHESPDRMIGDLAGLQHGVVGRWQLRELGFTADGIEGRLGRGALLRVHRGVYAVGHRSLTVEGRWIAAVLACEPGAVLTHRTAGQLWGIVPRSPIAPEVTRPTSFRARPGIRGHQAALPTDEIEEVGGIRVTSVSRTLFDLAAVSSERQLERAMNEANVRRLTSRLSLPQLLERYPGRRGAVNLRGLLGSKRPCGITRNDFEEQFVAFLDANGLPRPRLNATLAIRGRFLQPDCVWDRQRLLLELDGREVHGTEQAFESDRERDRILLVEGWRSTRVTWRQLHDEPAAIAADLRHLLGAS